MAFAGTMRFNPLEDSLVDSKGQPFKFAPPQKQELPPNGFTPGRSQMQVENNSEPGTRMSIKIDPNSDRLQALDPFDPWNQKELRELPLLVKVKGKCTTDHIRYSWISLYTFKLT